MAKGTATQRTLELLRDWGWYYWAVERFNGFSGRRTDLYHIIDYIVITDHSTIGIQSCGTDFSGHVNKLMIDEADNTILWLRCKRRKLILIGWRKVLKKRGWKVKVWKPRIAWLYIVEGELVLEEKKTY